MAQLSCQSLTLGYDGDIILGDVNFEVNKGDYLCILGENGTGKSTLMKAMLGLKKPMQGSITLGEELQSNEIGYLTQQSDIQKEFPATVQEIVLSGCQGRCGLRPFYNRAERQLAKESLAKLGMAQYEKRFHSALSGGQQQRVLLARALCATQKVLFLDEPVAGLDQNVSTELYEVIKNLNETEKITIVMISHDIETALHYASHILHVGKTSFFGTTAEYLQHTASTIFKTHGKGGEV